MGTLGFDLERGLFLGIDFGTTNSVASVYNFSDGEARTIPIDGGNIFPTAVQFEADPEDDTKLSRIFGTQAREGAVIYPQSTILSVKRLLGNEEKIEIIVGEKKYSFTPEQVAGDIIGYIKQKSDEYAQEELNIAGEFSGCVITVPANSTDKQKKKIKESAILGGFDENNVYLRLEPAAAAISYAVNETSDKRALVYDFGGGTFDACVIQVKIEEIGEPSISILSSYGDNNLGGNDVDKIIIDMVYEEFKRLTGGEIDLFDDEIDDGVSKRQKKVALVRLQQAATQAKERLSTAKTAKVVLAPFLQEPRIVSVNMEITREDFLAHRRVNQLGDSDELFEKFRDKNVEDMIGDTLRSVDKCLEAAGLTDVDEIFLVGGSSSIPRVSELIKEKFNKEPFKSRVSPALSISQGAAYYCNMIMMPTVKGPVVQEKTIHPIGLEIAGRRFLEIVASGVDIPKEGLAIEAKELLTTNFDNVTSMAIVVYENTSPEKSDKLQSVNSKGMIRLAGTSLRGIPQGEKGKEKVKVIFNVGQDNMLRVTARSMSESGAVTELSVDELYK
ncbi:MAG: Hsp70 family protein [Clostridiales bacterium]|nr:Hsp70 family protein [Clostridiales bacterium]